MAVSPKISALRTATLMLVLVSNFAFGQAKFLFIENSKQWHENVLYQADIPSGQLYLEKDGLKFNFYNEDDMVQLTHPILTKSKETGTTLRGHVYKMTFVDCNARSAPSGDEKSPTVFNYFLGSDKTKWASEVAGYQKITYNEIYKGIDVEIHSSGDRLKYDLIVQPGGDCKNIKIRYDGQDKIKLKDGNLHIKTSVNALMEQAPYAYQEMDGKRITVPCNFVLSGKVVSFEFPKGFNKSLPLVIDPLLTFSTFSGSFANNFGYSATFDRFGFLYSGSSVFGLGYPTTAGAYQVSFAGGVGQGANGGTDIALSKYDLTGSSMVWSTYLGGNGDDLPHSLIVNAYDELFVYGTTGSNNFPTTTGAYDSTFAGGTNFNPFGIGIRFPVGCDIFVSRLNSNGTALLASTYVGGTRNDGLDSDGPLKYNYADEVRGEVFIDESNNVYVATSTNSNDFPTSTNAFQPLYGGGPQDGVVFRMDNNLKTMVWSSFLGGSSGDACYAIALDSRDNLYLTGGTRSANFPFTPGVLQPSFAGGRCDAYITKVDKFGKAIMHSTFWGSPTYDQSYLLEVDRADNVYILGQTEVLDSTFIHNAGYGKEGAGQFITKMGPELDTLIWSTAFGTGNGVINISPVAMLVDYCDKIYISGWGGIVNNVPGNNAGTTTGMDITPGANQTTTDGSDFYLLVMEDDVSALAYATFHGGSTSPEHVDGGTSRFDRGGKIYQCVCAGCQNNDDFPSTPGALSSTNNSTGCNSAVFKFDFEMPVIISDFDVQPVCLPNPVTFQNLSQNATTFVWDFGDGFSSFAPSPSHVYAAPGVYPVTLFVANPLSCNLSDIYTHNVLVMGNSTGTIDPVFMCLGDFAQIGIPGTPDPSVTYQWDPVTFLSDPQSPNPTANPPVSITYSLIIDNGICRDTIQQRLYVIDMQLAIPPIAPICDGDSVTLTANSFSTANTYFWSTKRDFSGVPINNPLSPTVKVAPSVPTMYYLRADSFSCSIADSVFVDLASSQIEMSNDTIICPNTTAQLSVTNLIPASPLIYDWSPDASILVGDSTENITVQPTSEGYYRIKITNGVGCDFYDSILVSIPQDMYLQVPTDTVICNGAPIVLRAHSQGTCNEFYWTLNSNFSGPYLNLPSDSFIFVVPSTPTMYYIRADSALCSIRDSVFVDQSDVQIRASNDTLICPGDIVALTVLNLIPPGPLQYDWSPDAQIISGDGTAAIQASPPTSTQYFIDAVNSEGCSTQDSVMLYILENQLLQGTEDTVICEGESVTLRVTLPLNVGSFLWSLNSGFIGPPINPPGSDSIVVMPIVSTTYYVQVSVGGCSIIDSVLVQPANALISISNDTTVCPSNPAFLQIYNANPSIGITVDWSPNAAILSGDFTQNVIVSVPVTSTIYAQITTLFGCIIQDSVLITISNNVQLNTDNDTMICDGDAATLTAQDLGPNFNYHWTTDPTFQAPPLNSPTNNQLVVSPSIPTTYYIRADSAGCEIFDSIFVNLASAQVVISPDTVICLKDTIRLRATNLIPADPLVFDWEPKSQIVSGANTDQIVVSPPVTTTYVASTINGKGCPIENSVTVTVSRLSQLTFTAWADDDSIPLGTTTVLHVTPDTSFAYLWSPTDGLNTQTAAVVQASPTETTEYSITISDGICNKTLPILVYVYTEICGEPDVYVANAFSPDGNLHNDVVFVHGRNIKEMNFLIFDRWGEKVFETDDQARGWDGVYKDRPADPGVFVYHLTGTCDNNETFFLKGNITLIR